MLFMKAGLAAVGRVKVKVFASGVDGARATSRAIRSAAPVFCSARVIISIAATVITAGCPKPAKAVAAGMIPIAVRVSSATTATAS